MIQIAFSLRGRILLDALLASLFVLAFGLRFTGELAHELIGFAALIMLGVHLAAGWTWIQRMFFGVSTASRWYITALNLLIFIASLATFGSGLLLFLETTDAMWMRQVHTSTAYWLLVFSGLHVGLYWERVTGCIKNAIKGWSEQKKWADRLSKVGLVFVVYGVWASFERGMGEKLFSGVSFDFWNPDWPIVLFFLNHFAIISVYIFAAQRAASRKKQ